MAAAARLPLRRLAGGGARPCIGTDSHARPYHAPDARARVAVGHSFELFVCLVRYALRLSQVLLCPDVLDQAQKVMERPGPTSNAGALHKS
eukprot:2851047-Pleurochrysis_carterae.AAC.1